MNTGTPTNVQITGVQAIHHAFSALNHDDVEFDAIVFADQVGHVCKSRGHRTKADLLASFRRFDNVIPAFVAFRCQRHDTHLKARSRGQHAEIVCGIGWFFRRNQAVPERVRDQHTNDRTVVRHVLHGRRQDGTALSGQLFRNDFPAFAFFQLFSDQPGLRVRPATRLEGDQQLDRSRRGPVGRHG